MMITALLPNIKESEAFSVAFSLLKNDSLYDSEKMFHIGGKGVNASVTSPESLFPSQPGGSVSNRQLSASAQQQQEGTLNALYSGISLSGF